MHWKTLLLRNTAVEENGGESATTDTKTPTSTETQTESTDNLEPPASEPVGEKIPVRKGPTTIPDSMKGEELISLAGLKDDNIERPAPKKDEKKVEDKKETTAPAKQAANTNAQPEKRDYSLFGGEDSAEGQIVKKLPNHLYDVVKSFAIKHKTETEAHAATKKQLEEASKGVVKLPESYYEHPEAYKVDPEYQQTALNLQLTHKIRNHYREQQVRIKAGDSWKDIVAVNDDGTFKYSEEITADKTTPEMLQNIEDSIANSRDNIKTYDAQLANYHTTHQAKHKELVSAIKGETKKFFPWYGDEKQMTETKHKIAIGGKEAELSIKDIADKFTAFIPSGLRTTPLADPLIHALTALSLANARIAELAGKQQIVQQIKKDESAAEPVLSGKTSTTAKKGSELIGSTRDMREDD